MPVLAHTATSTGPNTEILLLGAGAIVLAIVFFFQKSASRQASLILAVGGAVAITGAFTLSGGSDDGDHHAGVTLAIASPEDGATVEAGAVAFEIEVAGAELAGESSADDAGHLHVMVDGEVVDMPSELELEIDLEPGEREVMIEFVGADHAPLAPPVVDSVTVTAE